MILLDTTALIDILRGEPAILKKISEFSLLHDFATTEINRYELLFGE